jgi:restriction system protein
MQAAFRAASSQPMGSQATFRSNSTLIADAFVPVPPVRPGQTVPHLIRSTILQFGEQILEGKDKGRIVEVVLRPWFELTEAILKDPKAAYEVPAEIWEEIVAERYKEEGWDEVILTPRSGDSGRDIVATTKTKLVGVVRIIDQVKRYTPPNKVTANDVRAMVGILPGDGATKAFVTTTAEFAPGVRSDPFISPHIPNRLELINGPELYRKLGEIIAARKSDNH